MSSSKNSIRAGIVDNALVVSFLSADAPRVWRTDMTQFLNAAIEVQESQGKFSLVMKRSNAAAEEIGTFTDKKSAVEALQVLTDLLLQGQGSSQPKKCGWFKKLLKFVLYLAAAFFLFLAFLSFAHHSAGQGSPGKTPAAQTGVPTGVPTPADNIIGK